MYLEIFSYFNIKQTRSDRKEYQVALEIVLCSQRRWSSRLKFFERLVPAKTLLKLTLLLWAALLLPRWRQGMLILN